MEISAELRLRETKVNKRKMEGEVRRIHIIYFLSRKGRIEHPHLVRVHHFSQNGVHLCDVKRWLAELRGKDMPESFAWSYKRRYRTGYVWQDLVDEDLITPISDNEYVLKGSEIPSNNITNSIDVSAEQRACTQKENSENEEIPKDQNLSSLEEIQQHQQTTIYISPKTSPIFSPEASTLTESSINLEEEKLLDKNKKAIRKEPNLDKLINSLSFNSTRSNKDEKKKKKNKNKYGNLINNSNGTASPRPKSPFIMVRRIFNCRAVETKDSVMININKRKCDKEFCNIGKTIAQDENSSESINKSHEICKEDSFGRSERVLLWKQQKCPSARRSHDGVKRSNSTRSQSKSPKPHRPINGPNCSQCGKMFKPEKMHKHMRSCSGRRSFGKGSGVYVSSATPNTDHDLSSRSMDYSTSQELLSGYYLNYHNKE